jgi:hypothetical protein
MFIVSRNGVCIHSIKQVLDWCILVFGRVVRAIVYHQVCGSRLPVYAEDEVIVCVLYGYI